MNQAIIQLGSFPFDVFFLLNIIYLQRANCWVVYLSTSNMSESKNRKKKKDKNEDTKKDNILHSINKKDAAQFKPKVKVDLYEIIFWTRHTHFLLIFLFKWCDREAHIITHVVSKYTAKLFRLIFKIRLCFSKVLISSIFREEKFLLN